VTDPDELRPPARLRALLSWQINKANVIGARLTGARMPVTGRSDFAVLAALEEYGALSQADLGRRLGLDRNTVNGIATRLDAGGHIVRSTDPSDRRRNTVEITPAGIAYLDELQAATDAVQADLTAHLTDAQTNELRALLAALLNGHPTPPA
jgi:DNA-binding MarR family transcriptional regulator